MLESHRTFHTCYNYMCRIFFLFVSEIQIISNRTNLFLPSMPQYAVINIYLAQVHVYCSIVYHRHHCVTQCLKHPPARSNQGDYSVMGDHQYCNMTLHTTHYTLLNPATTRWDSSHKNTWYSKKEIIFIQKSHFYTYKREPNFNISVVD